MAKVRAYIRVAKSGNKYRIEAGSRPSVAPIIKKGSYNHADEYLPTVSFAIDLDVADALFANASKVVATINVSGKNAVIAAEVSKPEAKE